MKTLLTTLAFAFLAPCSSACISQDVDIEKNAAVIAKVGPKGAGHQGAVKAVAELAKVEKAQLPELLKSMDDMSLLSSNWMRGAVEMVADKPDGLPVYDLIAFLEDEGHSQQARRIAYELLTDARPKLAEELLPGMLEDSSLENRRDAVDHYLAKIEKINKEANKDEAIAAYQKALDHARSIKQIQSIIKTLKQLGVEVSITKRLGYLTRWNVIAPFDNTDQSGFDVAYPPESRVKLDESLEGKTGEVSWVKVESDEDMGKVDLADKLDKHKGAIAYCYREFVSNADRPAEIRITCKNSHKIWLNGELVVSNEIYHAGSSLDQYKGKIKLKKGNNAILMKICQNEQEENWAQDWGFQVRICDSTGKAIHSQERGEDNI